jgi:hypothetical protein
MMRNIAIGVAAAAIALGGSTLSASALHGHKNGIGKGGMSYEEQRERGRIAGYEPDRFDGIRRLAPREREHVRSIVREGVAQLTPRERAHLRGIIRERLAASTPQEREHLRGAIRERLAELSPRERAHLRGVIRERLAELSPLERRRLGAMMMRESYEQLGRVEREHFHHHGPYGHR